MANTVEISEDDLHEAISAVRHLVMRITDHEEIRAGYADLVIRLHIAASCVDAVTTATILADTDSKYEDENIRAAAARYLAQQEQG